jgi:hypothetical protein
VANFLFSIVIIEFCSGHLDLEHLAHHGGTENTEFFIDFSVPSVPPWLDLCDAELFNQTLTITVIIEFSLELRALPVVRWET